MDAKIKMMDYVDHKKSIMFIFNSDTKLFDDFNMSSHFVKCSIIYSLYVDQYAVKFIMHLPKNEKFRGKRANQPLFGFLLLISSLKLLESYQFQRSSECNFGANSGHIVS
jgi:hypothetical protein